MLFLICVILKYIFLFCLVGSFSSVCPVVSITLFISFFSSSAGVCPKCVFWNCCGASMLYHFFLLHLISALTPLTIVIVFQIMTCFLNVFVRNIY